MITKLEVDSYKLMYLMVYAQSKLNESLQRANTITAQEMYTDIIVMCKTINNFLLNAGKEKTYIFNDDFILR